MEQRRQGRRRGVIAALAVLWMASVFLRLAYLQLFCYRDYVARAQRQQQRIVEISPKRGSLYDRNGRVLAASVPADSCFADPSEISDPAMVARLLSPVVGRPPEEIQTRLGESKYFCWIAHKISPEIAKRIQGLNLRGIYFQKENKRIYPQRTLAAHVLGFVDLDEHGLAGIDYALDKQIRGRAGRMMVLADGRRRWYDRNGSTPEPGASVALTLDENIQYIAEKELDAAMQESRALGGSVVIQDPNSGEILALANWPTFDPNAASSYSEESRTDRAVSSAYEPGSTFKLVTMAGALENGITRPSELVDCQMGSIQVGGRTIHDWRPFGVLSVEQVLAHSSDVGAIKIGLRLGAAKLYQAAREFGVGQLSGIELSGENRGLLRRVAEWSASSIGSISIGQEVSVTPVQMISAVSAIANGGTLYRPHVVKEIRAPGSELMSVPALASAAQPRRVLDERTAATLREMMEAVILEGTGRPAQPGGYTAAGKSGTAQKIDAATGRYSRTQYVASFTGFAPVNEPAITVLVVLDSPVGPHHGGEVAGPVFKRIAEQVLAYLDVPHDVPVAPPAEITAKIKGPTPSRQKVLAMNLARAKQAREAVPAQDGASHRPDRDANNAPRAELGGEAGIVVPNLLGQSVRRVTESCSRLGLAPVLVGSGLAVEQMPGAGTRIARGARIVVQFERGGSLVPVFSREARP